VGETEALLVRGNHDRHAGDPPGEAGFSVVEAPHRIGPFTLHHEPVEAGGKSDRHAPGREGEGPTFRLAGHLHPAVRLQGAGRDRLRLPCFWVQPEQMILPAFGGFTGAARIDPQAGDQVFVVGPDGVLPVPLG
jgi:metallophosphoesterase superfamily enzyme